MPALPALRPEFPLSCSYEHEGVRAVVAYALGREAGLLRELVFLYDGDDDERRAPVRRGEVRDLVRAFELEGLAVRAVRESARRVELCRALDCVKLNDAHVAQAARVRLSEKLRDGLAPRERAERARDYDDDRQKRRARDRRRAQRALPR